MTDSYVVATTAIRLCNAASPTPVLSNSRQSTRKTRRLLFITIDEISFDEHTAMGASSTFALLRGHAWFVFTVAATLLAACPLSVLAAQYPQVNVGETTVTGVSETFLGALGIDFFGGMKRFVP